MPTNAKVVLKNISRRKTILSLDFSNGESAILQYGGSVSIEEKYITPYIQRRINEGDLNLIKPVPEVQSVEEEKPSVDTSVKKPIKKGAKNKKEVRTNG